MKEKKRDKSVVKEAIGDPAFYNDQIGADREPVKAGYDKRQEKKKKHR